MIYWKNWKLFHSFFWAQKMQRKNILAMFQNENEPLWTIRISKSYRCQIGNFSKAKNWNFLQFLIGLKKKRNDVQQRSRGKTNLFIKMSISYRLFLLSRIFLKNIFLTYSAYKKQIKKLQLLDKNHGLTPLKKSQCFDLFTFFIFSVETLFSFQNILKHHFLAYFPYP